MIERYIASELISSPLVYQGLKEKEVAYFASVDFLLLLSSFPYAENTHFFLFQLKHLPAITDRYFVPHF